MKTEYYPSTLGGSLERFDHLDIHFEVNSHTLKGKTPEFSLEFSRNEDIENPQWETIATRVPSYKFAGLFQDGFSFDYFPEYKRFRVRIDKDENGFSEVCAKGELTDSGYQKFLLLNEFGFYSKNGTE